MNYLDPIRPYLALIKAAGAILLALALFVSGCQHGKKGLAEVKAKHAATLERIAEATQDQAEKAKQVEESFKHARREAERVYQKGVQDAHERGMAAAADIATGRQPVSWVWRDNCPKAPAGPGPEPAGGDPQVPEHRAEGMGRVRAIAGEADAGYAKVYARIAEAQKFVDACYEQPAQQD